MQTLKAIVLCLITGLLDISCTFFSVTVVKNSMPRSDFVHQGSGINMAIPCAFQRSAFNISPGEPCELHRWFYDARTWELTCVCIENRSTETNGMLLQQPDGSRAIPSISATNFRENQEIQQGQYSFQLIIQAQSNPEEIVDNLFSDVAKTNGALVFTRCYPTAGGPNSYGCSTGYYNKYLVTWEFPENWSGPVRFLKNIAYVSDKLKVEFVGLYWSRPLHVDVIMLVEEESTDACKKFFEQTTDKSLQPITKCHMEFIDKAVLNRPYFVTRINLLTPVERHATWNSPLEALSLANRLKWLGYSCRFPVQIRQEVASYVPSEAAALGKYFAYRVTFETSIIRKLLLTEPAEKEYCRIIHNLADRLKPECHIFKLEQNYGIADVLVPHKNASFWEVQRELMLTLNAQNRDVCEYNVEAKSVHKGY